MTETKITKKTNSELALEAHKKQTKIAKSAETSEIVNMMGKTKDFVVAEGTAKEYTVTLQFPGVARAIDIEDNATNRYGGIAFGILMREAIKDVIVAPRAKSIDDFWNRHKGFDEISLIVLNFLNEGISGELE